MDKAKHDQIWDETMAKLYDISFDEGLKEASVYKMAADLSDEEILKLVEEGKL